MEPGVQAIAGGIWILDTSKNCSIEHLKVLEKIKPLEKVVP